MPATRRTSWLTIILGSGLTLWLSLILLLGLEVEPLHAILWLVTIAIAIAGISLIAVAKQRQYGKAMIAFALCAAIAIAFLTTDLQARVIPFCGDGTCQAGECAGGCADCASTSCVDGVCRPSIENCATSADCACASGRACAPKRPKAEPDLYGCVDVACGDGFCDAAAESRDTCCADCGCASGFACHQDKCYFQPPDLRTSDYLLDARFGATSLAANPRLVDANGIPQPIAGVIVNVKRAIARNASAIFSLGPYATHVAAIGDIIPGSNATVIWQMDERSLRLTPLSVINDTRVNLTIAIEYYDTQGVRHLHVGTHTITIRGRSVLDAYGHRAFYVTPQDVPALGNTPEDIWNALGKRVRFDRSARIADSTIRFPVETIASGAGNAEEIAAAYASALLRAGFAPALVQTDLGTVVWVRDGARQLMVDPRRIGEPLENAVVSTPGYALEGIRDVWRDRNSTAPLRIGPELIPGALLSVHQNFTVTCESTGPCAVALTVVENGGLVPSPVCGTSRILRGTETIEQREICVTVPARSHEVFRHGWTGTGSCATIRHEFAVRNA